MITKFRVALFLIGTQEYRRDKRIYYQRCFFRAIINILEFGVRDRIRDGLHRNAYPMYDDRHWRH